MSWGIVLFQWECLTISTSCAGISYVVIGILNGPFTGSSDISIAGVKLTVGWDFARLNQCALLWLLSMLVGACFNPILLLSSLFRVKYELNDT